jgi:hypothetical protein
MKICYLDECGHCGERPNRNQPVETVCGVVTDAAKVFKTQREHGDVLDILRKAGIEINELKSAEIYRGRNEWSDTGHELRDRVFGVLLNWAKERKCKYIPCPIDSLEFFERKSNGCEMCTHLQYPFEAGALNAVLALQREFRNSKNNKGKTIVIFDEQKKHDERLLNILEGDLQFTDSYTKYVAPRRAKPPPRLEQIVDVPHFSKSHLAVLIQIADIGAFVVNRHIDLSLTGTPERYAGERKKIDSWYRLMAENIINHTSIDPPGQDELCRFYRGIRPAGWTSKSISAMASR